MFPAVSDCGEFLKSNHLERKETLLEGSAVKHPVDSFLWATVTPLP